MKRLFAAMTAALLMVALVSSVALAAPGKGSATKFVATYDYAGASFVCSGVRVANNNVTKDNETCLVTGGAFVAGTYTGNPWGTLAGFGWTEWASDLDALTATSWTITETDNGNGTFTFGIAAIY
jgi:hypothetical protein